MNCIELWTLQDHNTSFYEHLDTRKQCFSAEKRTKITRKSPIFAQSEKVKIQQKSLTSPLNAWTINTSIYQLHCVKIWRESTHQEPRYPSFCSWLKIWHFEFFQLVDTPRTDTLDLAVSCSLARVGYPGTHENCLWLILRVWPLTRNCRSAASLPVEGT